MPPKTRTTKASPAKTSPKAEADCKITDCTKTATTRGLCDGHWMSRRGDADPKTKD